MEEVVRVRGKGAGKEDVGRVRGEGERAADGFGRRKGWLGGWWRECGEGEGGTYGGSRILGIPIRAAVLVLFAGESDPDDRNLGYL